MTLIFPSLVKRHVTNARNFEVRWAHLASSPQYERKILVASWNFRLMGALKFRAWSRIEYDHEACEEATSRSIWNLFLLNLLWGLYNLFWLDRCSRLRFDELMSIWRWISNNLLHRTRFIVNKTMHLATKLTRLVYQARLTLIWDWHHHWEE